MGKNEADLKNEGMKRGAIKWENELEETDID